MRAEPGKITIASGRIGSATHLTAELFQARTGVKLVHVPFRGAGPAMNDLVAVTCSRASRRSRRRTRFWTAAARLRSPARRGPPRSRAFRRFRENGIDLVVEVWWGVLAPAGLPPEIAARLTGELKAILDSPETAARLARLGVTPSHASPAQFRAVIESDAARWANIVRSAGISLP